MSIGKLYSESGQDEKLKSLEVKIEQLKQTNREVVEVRKVRLMINGAINKLKSV